MSAFRHSLLVPVLVMLALVATLPAARAELVPIDANAGETAFQLRAQDAAGVDIRYAMPAYGLEAIDVDGETLQQVILPGSFLPNNPGAPDLPGFGRFIAVPFGAEARVTILSAQTRTLQGVDVLPAAPIQFENDDTPPTHVRDAAIYGRSAGYPASPVLVSAPEEWRGVTVVTLGITPFQYNPVTRELTIYTDLDIRVDFVGGTGRFTDDRLRNRYWEGFLRDQLVNYETLPAVDFNSSSLLDNRSGFEYVIITPDNATCLAWADSIKTWRNTQGISTEVFTTTETGTTSTQIESWLNNAYNTWDVPPVAFLILGDYPSSGDAGEGSAELAPGPGDEGREVLPGVTAPIYSGYCVSDNIYADVNGNGLPEMVHARICARTDVDLSRIMTKFFKHERQPVTDPDFYAHPLISGGWQTERWFILCAEVIYGHQANALGKTPVREYAIYSGYPGSVWSTASNTSTVVNYWGPSGRGYIPQTPAHLTDWTGNYVGINQAINAGAYFVVHRDHGLESGWGEPAYSNGHLTLLTNTEYPFVFSVNCLTGKYNWSGCSFAEYFHRLQYGAVGLLAASEVSYSFVNDAYIWGVFDAMWPGFDPNYGSGWTSAATLRPAFGQTYGKYYLQASSWPSNPSNKAVTYNLFHHHGDAFIFMHDRVPTALTVVHEDHLEPGEGTFTVQAEVDALIGLSVDGVLIGAADATGAPVAIPIPPQAQGHDLRVVVTKANRLRYDVRIPIEMGSLVVDPEGGGSYLTIQAAINAAENGDLIELVPSVFTGAGNRDLDFLGKAITIQSLTGNAQTCIIDCQNAARGFSFVNEEGAAAVLQNVTIRNALVTDSRGGAIYCSASSPTLNNVRFVDNHAAGEGGVGAALAAVYGASPRLNACVFAGNQSTARGADLYCYQAAVLLDHCTLYGGSSALGGLIVVDDGGLATLQNTIVAFGQSGQAIECLNGGTARVDCCDIFGNAGGDWVDCLAGQYGLTNISLDPQFCDAAARDFTLWNYTPCVSEMCGQVGAFGIGCQEPSDVRPGAGSALFLGAARPNPFTQATRIAYEVASAGERALLQVFDPSGRLVRTLVDREESAGHHAVAWDGTDETGARLASGVYYYQLNLGAEQATRRVIVLR